MRVRAKYRITAYFITIRQQEKCILGVKFWWRCRLNFYKRHLILIFKHVSIIYAYLKICYTNLTPHIHK